MYITRLQGQNNQCYSEILQSQIYTIMLSTKWLKSTLEPVQFSEWAAPIVPVLKKNKQSIHICGDFRGTVNPVSKLDRYPIPKVEDLFANLSGGRTFTKIDLSQEYRWKKNLEVTVMVDSKPLRMEIDIGATSYLFAESTFKELWPDKELNDSKVRLCSYSGEPIPVLGCANVKVEYKGQMETLPLIVATGTGPSLLGHDWLQAIKLDWREINYLQDSSLQDVLHKYKSVFRAGLGTLQGFKAKIIIEDNAIPKFCKARSIPYAFKEMVEKELNRLVSDGTLELIQFSEWAAPIVPVLKKDKQSIRIRGDFRRTVNPVSKLDRYPIPKVEDLFAHLSGVRTFTKIDLCQAYQQIPLEEESQKCMVINTQGLFAYHLAFHLHLVSFKE